MKSHPAVTLALSLVIGVSPALTNTLAAAGNDTATPFDTVVTTTQQTAGRASLSSAIAAVGADTLRNASGNIGVNVAAGTLNAQVNQIVAVNSSTAVIDTAQNVSVASTITGGSRAQLGAGALAHASGNIGLNIVSGAGNAQANTLVVH
jgi:hypothetical protein